MSLEHALLGFLQYTPLSGYDLKKTFDTTVNHFWPADQSQIYRTLNKLTTEGLIDMELVIQKDKPNSKIYHITKKGEEEFLDWLKSPINMATPRIPLLVQIYFAAELSDEVIISIFEKVADQIRDRINSFKNVTKAIFIADTKPLTQRDLFFKELTYDYGLTINNAILNWIEKVIEQIQKGEYQ
ncbi:MAG: PadR family transcriptional regulator [Bacillota bacterium]|nr:PadR family transcriptional regulator [Bacillota bacterium]